MKTASLHIRIQPECIRCEPGRTTCCGASCRVLAESCACGHDLSETSPVVGCRHPPDARVVPRARSTTCAWSQPITIGNLVGETRTASSIMVRLRAHYLPGACAMPADALKCFNGVAGINWEHGDVGMTRLYSRRYRNANSRNRDLEPGGSHHQETGAKSSLVCCRRFLHLIASVLYECYCYTCALPYWPGRAT
jgi:hypothetical protein